VNPVAKFESFVERLMERTLTGASHSRLQPVEIGKRLARVMDADQVVGTLGVRVPNIFDVELSPVDYGRLKPIRASVTRELETYLARVARDRLFVLASPPIIRLHENSELKQGEIAVRAQMEDLGPIPSPPANGRPVMPERPEFQNTRAMPSLPRAPAAPLRQHLSQLVAPDRSYRLEIGPISVGRAPDNEIVLDDRRVSRHHAELTQTDGRWALRDLASTNGTAVNGRIVQHALLHDGDRLSLGGFEVIFQD